MGEPDDIRQRLASIPDPVALLEGLFSHAPVAIVVYDAKGECLVTNQAFHDLFGAAPPPGYNLLKDEVAQQQGVAELVKRAFAGETVSLPSFWYDAQKLEHVKVSQGRRVGLSGTFFPLTARTGEVTHVAIAFKDVSAEIEAREQAELRQHEAEAAAGRAEFLAEASAVLSESLDYERALKRLAELVVPRFADWCTVVASDDQGAMRRLAAAHVDPQKARLVREYLEQFPPDLHNSPEMLSVLRGTPMLHSQLGDGDLARAAQSPRHLDLLRELGCTSCVMVPMVVGGKPIGALSLMRRDGRRPYAQADLQFAQELAYRAALATEHARSFAQTKAAEARNTMLISELKASEERLRAVFDSRLVGIGYWNGRGEILDPNPLLTELTGYSAEEIRRKRLRWADLTPREWSTRDEDALRETKTVGFSQPYEKEYLHKSGRRVPVLAGSAKLQADGDFGVSFCVDVSARRELEIERERLLESARFLAEAGAVLSASLEHEEILHRLTNLLVPGLGDWCTVELEDDGKLKQLAVAHTDPEKVRWAKELRERYPPNMTEDEGLVRVLRTGTPQLHPALTPEQVRASARDPEHLRILEELGVKSVIIVPLGTGRKIFGVLTLIAAESNRRYTEADLSFVLELARRASLAVENARLYSDLRASVRVRDDFLSIAGHELRTPLAALLMQVQGVQKLLSRENLSPGLVERLEKTSRSARRLKALINQLLDVSRITAGKLVLETGPMDLSELVSEVVARFRENADENAAPIETQLAPQLRGVWDHLRLEQVVSNLLSNAMKYGGGRPVRVRTWRDGPFVWLSVKDQGIGISAEQQRRLFERFERAVETREYGGIGLGLWISRQTVEASGGTIELHSQPGNGSEFVVKLPLGVADDAHVH